MVDVNDPSGIGDKLQKRREQVREADIDDRDRAAILEFVNHRKAEGLARNTRRRDLSTLRCASERADTPLVDMSLGDVRQLMNILVTPTDEGGYGLEPDGTGMFGYKRSLKVFFRYLDELEEHADYPFYDDISLPDLEVQGSANREEMLSGDEIEALKDAARNPRDRAFIALLADIGGRVTMLLSLRVGDVHLDGDEPFFEPNQDVEDGHKDLESTEIPILYSRAEVRTFVRHHHPDKATADAPLWPLLRGYDYEDPQSSAMGDDRARDVLKECAARAEIEKPVNPHNFRRTGATRMSNSDRLTDKEIRQVLGWADNRPLEFYDLTRESERNSAIHQALGFSEGSEEDGSELDMEIRVCGECREQNAATAHYCQRCGEPLTEDARSTTDAAEDTVTGNAIDEDDPSKRDLKGLVREVLKEDPSVLGDAHESSSASDS